MGGNKKPRRPWQCAHSKMQLVAQEKHVENILLEEEARSKVMPMVSPCYLPCHMLAPCSPPSSCSSGTIINTPENIFRSKYKTPKIHLHQGTIACLQVRNVVLVVVVAGTRFLKTACERSSQNDELDMEALAKLRSIIKVVCTHRFRRQQLVDR